MSENHRPLSTDVSYNHELVLQVSGKGENLEADGWQPPKCVFVSHGFPLVNLHGHAENYVIVLHIMHNF